MRVGCCVWDADESNTGHALGRSLVLPQCFFMVNGLCGMSHNKAVPYLLLAKFPRIGNFSLLKFTYSTLGRKFILSCHSVANIRL